MDKNEGRIHQDCYVWFHNSYPQYRGLLCYNLNNSRDRIEGAKNRSKGVQPGRSDFVIYYHHEAFMIELKEGDGAEYWSLPTWLWDQLCLERGVEWTRAFAQSCLERPVNTTVNQDGSVAVFQGIFHGDGFVQDISNQALVQEVIALQPRHVLDLCAAPGGKSLGLVQGGMTVTATDKHREPMLRSSVGTKVRVMGWEQVWADASLFADCVWIDAPCSAMGLIRRHPEIKWNRVMLDVEALVKVQTALLAQVWERLAPGALLVYSVCSVMKAEGEAVTAQYVPIKEWLYAPHLTGGDGMYAALMRKPA